MKSNASAYLLGLVSFLSAFFFLQGLPLTFGDDLNIIEIAKKSSWWELLFEYVNPFTPAWYVHGAECQLTTRVFQTLLFKLMHFVSGYQFDVYNFHKSLAFGVCTGFIFKIVSHVSPNRLGGWVAALFFLFSSPIYFSTSWVADTEIVAQAFLVISFYNFLKITSVADSLLSRQWIMRLLGYFFCAWTAIKLKETARLIPFVVIAYLFFSGIFFKQSMDLKRRGLLGVISAVTALLLFAVVPFFPDANLKLDGKSVSALSRLQPLGIINFFKFYISDIFYPLALALIFLLAKPWIQLALKDERKGSGMSAQMLFLIFWCGAACTGLLLNFNFSDANTRYFTTALIPFYILTGILIAFIVEKFSFAPLLKQSIIVGVLVLSCVRWGVPTGNSFFAFKPDESVFFRNFYLGVNVADFKLTQAFYHDYTGRFPSMEDLDGFYRSDTDRFSELRRKEWDPNVRISDQDMRATAERWGAAYVFSLRGDLEREHPFLKLIHSTNTHNGSLYNKIFSKIKKKSIRGAYLYKWSSLQ